MKTVIQRSGYQLDSLTSVWQKPDYAGIAYSDGDEIENRIADIIKQAADVSVLSDELRQHCTDWPSTYHLSATRANLLRPFQHLLNQDVLEIGAGCGAITRFLGEAGANVLALEGSPRRAAIARSRTRDLPNVAVVAEAFDAFHCDHKFDVVTLIGVLEYANLFTPGEDPALAMLNRVLSFLKPDGKLILAIENQLGLKYFAGAPEDHLGKPMYGIEGRYGKQEPQTFGREVLTQKLTEAGFANYEFLTPFPDYKLPVSVVTTAGMGNENFDASAFAWQTPRRDPQLPFYCNFSLELAWPQIVSNGLMLDLSNSFLVAASPLPAQFTEQGVFAYHYSSNRYAKFCKQIGFRQAAAGEVRVEYTKLSEAADDAAPDTHYTFSCPDACAYTYGYPLSLEFIDIVTRDGWEFQEVSGFLRRYISLLGGLMGEAPPQFEDTARKPDAAAAAPEDAALQREDAALKSQDTPPSPEDAASNLDETALTPDDAAHMVATGPTTLQDIALETPLPGRCLDLAPQNIIISADGNAQIIDTEWSSNDAISLGYLLFRSTLWMAASLTRFGRPAGDKTYTNGEFVTEAFRGLGLTLSAEDVAKFIALESRFQQHVNGAPADEFLNNWLTRQLPTDTLQDAYKRRDEEAHWLRYELGQRDAELAHSHAEIGRLHHHIAIMTQAAIERDAVIDGIYNSLSWRLTQPLRSGKLLTKQSVRAMKRAASAVRRAGGVAPAAQKAVAIYRNEGIAGIKRRFGAAAVAHQENAGVAQAAEPGVYAEWIRNFDTLTDEMRASIRQHIDQFPEKPVVSIVMPTYNPKAEWLQEAIESVRSQIYPHWELCIADDASTHASVRPLLQEYARKDARIKLVLRDQNGHISAASNSALQLATGQWVTLLDHDDVLTEDALYQLMVAAHAHPDADLIYSDEDKLGADGVRSNPFFKPDWSPHLALSQAYLGHLVCFKAGKLETELYFDEQLNGAQDFDLWLRCTAGDCVVKHVPQILYHWREHEDSTAANADSKPYADDAGRLAVEKCVARRYPDAEITVRNRGDLFTYELDFGLPADTLISIIIPTKDRIDLLSACIDSIFEKSDWKNFEIIIIDNQSAEPESHQYFQDISKKHENVKVLEANIPFNWSRLNNMGAQVAQGSVLLFLNNDTEVIAPNWLRSLAGYARLPDVGVVGGLLKYPDGTIQHSGVVVGMGGWADHVFKAQPAAHSGAGPFVSPVLTRNVLAVTGACMAITKEKFDQLGGFDEAFIICGSDVELCIRAHHHGYFNVMCAEAVLFHYESKTRTSYIPEDDFRQSEMKYAPYRNEVTDPYFNRNLSLETPVPTVAFGPRNA